MARDVLALPYSQRRMIVVSDEGVIDAPKPAASVNPVVKSAEPMIDAVGRMTPGQKRWALTGALVVAPVVGPAAAVAGLAMAYGIKRPASGGHETPPYDGFLRVTSEEAQGLLFPTGSPADGMVAPAIHSTRRPMSRWRTFTPTYSNIR